MATITRRIGLSLGADICWPICFEEILARAHLKLPRGADELLFSCERLTIEPFDLRQQSRYDVVIDRLTHWFQPSREWIKKAILLDELYVFNNPWTVQSMEKATTYCAMIRLGLPIPQTWLVPPKSHAPSADLRPTLTSYARLFDLGGLGQKVGYPMFMKPYDGGAWVGVSRIADEAALRAAYEQSGQRVMHLQAAVEPHDLFVRTVGLGPMLRSIRYDPSAPLHDRYQVGLPLAGEELGLLGDITLTINAFFGWDFNSCECLRQGETWYPIDFANPCPDSQVTSLHYHFPWYVLAKLRWSLFCAATDRKMRVDLDWQAFFDIADATAEAPYRERIAAYAKLARQRLQAAEFSEFCQTHLAHLDEVAIEFFGTDIARDAVRKKVAAMYPAHEIDEFSDRFWQGIQRWRDDAQAQLSASGENC